MYMAPVSILLGLVFYSYSIMKQKQEIITEFQEKDYKTLTLWQMKKKESLTQQSKQFDSVLNALQSKLQDEYQEQLHEFQEFVSNMDSENSEN